jgi:ethanolamine utilization microcompartment shell protein EutL
MNIVVEYSEAEVQALVALMDAGVRALGLQAAGNAAILHNKLNEATKAARVPVLVPRDVAVPEAAHG